MHDRTDDVAVVTGGGSGIGRALAERFAREGMRVVLADVDLIGLASAARRIAEAHGPDRVLAVPTDVRDPDAVEALAAATVEHFGAVHVVCNNAGVGSGGAAWEVTPARWRWVVAVSESLHLDLRNAHSAVGVSVLCPEWVRGTRIHDAERNLPAGVRDSSDREGAPLVDGVLRSLVNGGTDPDELAGEVLDAVRRDRFWVLPHRASTLSAARMRWAAIEEDQAPPTWDFGVRARSKSEPGERRGRRRRTPA